jgi:hypothetical protein
MPLMKSDPPKQDQNDNDDQDEADDTDSAVTVAVAVATEAATEAAEQKNDKQDDENGSEHARISFGLFATQTSAFPDAGLAEVPTAHRRLSKPKLCAGGAALGSEVTQIYIGVDSTVSQDRAQASAYRFKARSDRRSQ